MPDIVISSESEKPAAVPEKNKIYSVYDTKPQPQFPGGPDKFIEFIKTNMVYLPRAAEINIQGKVYLDFVIEPNGNITDITVPRKLGRGADEEAVRLLKL